MMRCRGADSRARRNAADPNRLSPKRHRPPELSLRGPKGAVAISGRHCRLVPAAVKTEPAPTGLVAALTAQPLAALPPYGCGVPLAGCERPLHRLPLTRYGRYAAEAIRDIPKFYSHASVDQSVVMPNHIHLLLRLDETPGQAGIPQIVRQMKAHVSKRAGFSIWQRSYYDHVIRGQKDYDMIWQYIADNPAKWLNDRFYEPDEP